MKIKEIHGYHLSCDMPEPVGNSLMYFSRRDALLIRLVTDDGISGWGETASVNYPAAAMIRKNLAPSVLGQPAADINRIYQAMTQRSGVGQRHLSTIVGSAIDMALHDILARAQGISVAQLLGGALRKSAIAYASGPFMRPGADPYARFGKEVDGLLKRNFRAFKPRVGETPRADAAMAKALRAQIGEDRDLMVDFNQGLSAGGAIDSIRAMHDTGARLLWIEEPIHPDDLAGYESVAARSPVTLAGGEALISVQSFRDFLMKPIFGVLQPDLAVCGGFTGMQQVAALGLAFNVPVVPHVFGTVVNFHASLAFAAILPLQKAGGEKPFPYVEYDVMGSPLLSVLGEPKLNTDGTIAIPEGPGLGFELKPEQLQPWLKEHWVEQV